MEGIAPLKMSEKSMAQDPILSRMLKIRRRSTALFMASFLGIVLLSVNVVDVGIPLSIFMIWSYIYSRQFRIIEKKNAEHLRGLGFDVK